MTGGFPFGPDICNGSSAGTDTTNVRGTAVTCGNGSYGSYAQIVASTAADTCFMTVTVMTNGASNSANQALIKIAVGGAGNEVAIVSDLISMNGSPGYNSTTYRFPMSIPAGTRIAAAGFSTAADVHYVDVQLWDGAFTQMEGAAGVDSMGISSDHGTSVTMGTGGTKGSYAQITASTARDYMGVFFAVDDLGLAGVSSKNFFLDIAIGAGGSEKIIIPDVTFFFNNMNEIGCGNFIPVAIPAGTRIAVRGLASGAQSIGVAVYGVYQ